MKVRISHCSDSVINYNLCLSEKVAGFANRGPKPGDMIYLVVKVKGKSLCGARFLLDAITDSGPWPDADRYVNVLTIKQIEYCTPFDISILSQIGGASWALKFMQGAKEIKDAAAIQMLDSAFNSNKIENAVKFETEKPEEDQEPVDEITIEDEKELAKVIKEIPDIQVKIMGTFQITPFSNETDKIKGLETLVNDNFYFLFPQFPEANSLLIPENRLFKTRGFNVNGNNVQGIRSIPDGLLIVFNRQKANPFQINIIEYECYGEKKTKETDKSTYLNSNVIPQLMRFASAFSIITDPPTRDRTIKDWVDNIIEYVNADEMLWNKVSGWIKEINPSLKLSSTDREIEKQLIEAFKTNLRVLLVIDELSPEQKSTIKNVVNSFKLASGENSVQFQGYVVRLVQKINFLNNESEYALTIQ